MLRKVGVGLACLLLLSACESTPTKSDESLRELQLAGMQLASTCKQPPVTSPIPEVTDDDHMNTSLEKDLRAAGFVLVEVFKVHDVPNTKIWVLARHPTCLTIQYEDRHYTGHFQFDRIYLGTVQQHRAKKPEPPLELDLECIPKDQLFSYGGTLGVLNTFRELIVDVRSGTAARTPTSPGKNNANYDKNGLHCFDNRDSK